MTQELSHQSVQEDQRISGKEIAVNAAMFCLISVLMVMISLAVLYGMQLMEHSAIALLTAVIVMASALITLVVNLMLGQRDPQKTAMVFMAGMMLRMLLCLSTVFILQREHPEAKMIFAGWLIGWYMAGLLIETILVVRTIPQTPIAKAPNSEDIS